MSSWKISSDAGEKDAAMAYSCCQAAVVRTSLRELQEKREDRAEEKITEEEEQEQKGHSYALLAQEELEDEEEEPKRSSVHHHGLKIPFQQKKWTLTISSNFIKFDIIRLNFD
jgi:hypothetical protein